MTAHPRFRSGPSLALQSSKLGLLEGLAGRWSGSGFNFILLPDFDSNPPSTGPREFRLLMNATRESLEFTPIGAPVPNRGSEVTGDASKGQDDIEIYGLRYLQQVSDANSHEPLHIEPGLWLNVPASAIPAQGPTVVRQGSIPHGSSVLLQGDAFLSPTGKPVFAPTSTTPVRDPPGPPFPLGYLDPILTAVPPPPFTDRGIVSNPNLVLSDDIASFLHEITKTVVLNVATAPVGGIVNIPFLQNTTNNNAAATSMTATFWIETVTPAVGRPYDVLQYTQRIILNFLGIDWPHVSVATLFRL